jgi:hypothetical protein
MKISQLVLLLTLASGCASHAEAPASAPKATPSGVPDPNSSPDLAPMTPGEPGSPTPATTTQKPQTGRLELRHFYRLAPGGKTALTVTECDAPCQAPQLQ